MPRIFILPLNCLNLDFEGLNGLGGLKKRHRHFERGTNEKSVGQSTKVGQISTEGRNSFFSATFHTNPTKLAKYSLQKNFLPLCKTFIN